ncbi:MAG: hypothetical protein RIB60_04245 [Phycisphaerales bacterium]
MSDMPPTNVPSAGQEPHRATLVFVLGLLGILLCQLLGPFAWIMGKGDLAKMESGRMNAEGKGLTQAGMICGIIATVLLCISILMTLLWVVFVIVLGVGAAAAGSGATP